MHVEVQMESVDALTAYAGIPIAFEVAEVLDLELLQSGLAGFMLRRRSLEAPYIKDYDALDGGPARWPERFDLSSWALFAAYAAGVRVGGAAVAFPTRGLALFEDRSDLAVLWDIRVAPAHRGRGVGAALVSAAAAWAAARACTQLKVETQNVNVPACALYARQGFVLGAIHRFAYSALPDEAQLLWYLPLDRGKRAGPRPAW
jgi:GNAT superfamily N-acetyltransferase